MTTLVTDCPRCGANSHTFDVLQNIKVGKRYDWATIWEVFSVCRKCHLSTIFILELEQYSHAAIWEEDKNWRSDINLNDSFRVERYVSIREHVARKPPDHVPEEISKIFSEGAVCLGVGCYNAASTMFRLCLDLATRNLLPETPTDGDPIPDGQPNRRQRRDLGLRIPWLIENGRLPAEFADFAEIVREDGNDGAHVGNLGKEDAEDLADFTELLLERLFTEPGRVAVARERRRDRRQEDVEA